MAQYAYNGWLASPNPADFGGLEPLVVAGESFAPGVMKGDVHDVLEYVAVQLHLRVESVVKPEWHQADDWGFNFRKNANANNLSVHGTGGAFDYNATRHPNGKRGTFAPWQVAEIHRILDEVDNVVAWGGDFTGTPDEMHFEIAGSKALVARVANKIRSAGVKLPSLTTPHRLLSEGAEGEDVWKLQDFMNRMFPRYKDTPIPKVNPPRYGPQTIRVMKEFQARTGITADGITGNDTYRELARLGFK